MNKILVTGGAGFIGSNFVNMVLNQHKDCLVINLDKLTYSGNLENLEQVMDNKNHIFVRGDICDIKVVKKVLEKYQPEAIINFAAETHVDRSIVGPKIFIDTNVNGTLALLEGARQVGTERFIQISTDEVYGSLAPGDGKFTESTPLSPNSPYSASKTAADHLVRAYGHTWNLNYNITRCSNNYGAYQFPEKMLPLMINNALNDKPLPVYGDGLQIRDWLYVYDHCTAIWKVLTNGCPGHIYNIGGCNEKTNMEVIETLLSYLEKPASLITHVKDRPGHDRRYAIDPSKIMNELDWQPSVTFEQGLKKTIDWYLQNGNWLKNIISGEYQSYYESMYSQR